MYPNTIPRKISVKEIGKPRRMTTKRQAQQDEAQTRATSDELSSAGAWWR
jgi:hypothetical protein